MKNLIFTLVLSLATFQLFAQCSLDVDYWELQNVNSSTGEFDFYICYSWANAEPTGGNGSQNIYFNIDDANGNGNNFMIIDNNVPYSSTGSNCGTVSVTGSPGSYTFTSPMAPYYFDSFTESFGGANETGISFNLDFNGICITSNIVYSTGTGNNSTCFDGIQNGDETGVDCGGSTCDACCPAAGTPCDDGDPCTTDDVEDGNCNCAGVSGGSNIAFDTGIGWITTNTASNQSDQFLPTTFSNAKVQILVTNDELTAAGFSAGDDIIAIEWYVDIDNTTTTTFDLYLDDDYTSTDLPSDAVFATGSPTLVGSNLSDVGQYTGWHTATLDSPFTWDGTDNLIIQVCRTGGNQSADDRIAIDYTSNISMVTGYNHSCTETTGYYSNTSRPSIRVVSNSMSSNDADEDGVCDAVDLCPNSVGTVDENGCVLGCTDATAHNFDMNAQTGDNSCMTCDDGMMNGDETGVDCGGSLCNACPTCFDGIQNGDETGVDCGGTTCDACPTCDDGLKNGDETGVDCGGPSCEPCICVNNRILVYLDFDDFASETYWEITNGNGEIVASSLANYPNQTVSTIEETCILNGCYQFKIGDYFGDGICCSYGEGSYQVTDANGNLLVTSASGGIFGYEEITPFCVDGVTCDDGLMNGDEEGVDCGGSSCTAICPTCDDGILNGDETEIDCGGSTCDACPTCDDGIMNGDETGVDCGGSCAAICPTCGVATGLAELNLTDVGATLTWDAQELAEAYKVVGRRVNGPSKAFETTENMMDFYLLPNNTYEWSVKVLCDGVWTDHAEIREFTTLPSTGKNAPLFDIFDDVETALTSDIYPNPATNEVNVIFMSSTQKDVQINVLDITGRIVMTQDVQSDTWETEVRLDISNLQNGYYFIEVNDGIVSTTSKLNVIK